MADERNGGSGSKHGTGIMDGRGRKHGNGIEDGSGRTHGTKVAVGERMTDGSGVRIPMIGQKEIIVNHVCFLTRRGMMGKMMRRSLKKRTMLRRRGALPGMIQD